ncbi:MAG TPA: C40 family peptidase [Candidatus Binatia bacterium]|jgi:cell wall-associated NlpC family hydrolase
MERQRMLALVLVLILLIAPNVLLVAEELSAAQPTVRQKLASMARSFLGLPYRWGGMSERRGADCSGLVKMLFAKLYIELPRSSREQIHSGEEVPMAKLETGDLVFFSNGGNVPMHVGVYMGNHQFLHAEKNAGRVIITEMNEPWYARRFLTARRVIGPWQGIAALKASAERLDSVAN